MNFFETLIDRMKPEKEVSLYVAKMAFETYKNLANFNPDSHDVLNFERAIEDWKNRKEDIIKIIF